MRSIVDLINDYLAALRTNDPTLILKCFTPDARIISPTYGEMPAQDFYRKLCADTESVTIAVHGIHPSASDPAVCIAHFEYLWVLKDGNKKSLVILDHFRVAGDRIKSLRIFADIRRDA